MASSSTPIRISSSSASGGNDSPTLTSGSLGQKSSSVPTAGSGTGTGGNHLQLQQMGSSNQSLGVAQMGLTGTSSITPPNSAGLRSATGIINWTSTDNKSDGNQTDKVSSDTTKLNRKESYKAQRKNYRREKKRVASELMNSLQDPSVIVLADWLKVRGTLKSWTKLWCVLKPGLLLIYKSPKTKSSHWVGTVLLTSCQVIERPSKKDGFCFKIFHPMEQSIWAPKGPEKETIGAVVQPLPTAYLIFRAPSQAAGKCWMDALELSLRCSALLLRSTNSNAFTSGEIFPTDPVNLQISNETQWSEADYEKHFNEQDLEGADSCNEKNVLSDNESESGSENDGAAVEDNQQEEEEEVIKETSYIAVSEGEIVTEAGETVEELAEEHKGLIWHLVKQVRPGMDLSKVVLPTFILEPRSFLDKLSDSYYHADLLSRAVNEDDPFTRMKTVVQWYLSGFYKKPKGLKKPYNPILGEIFRCYWVHPNGSRTYYIAEQVSHHPPISAFYVTNRQDGFSISCSILAKSKFYGNSTSAVLEGAATLTLLPRGESYSLTTPYAHCKGILMGTLSMELGGKIQIECINTGYKTDLEFKLKPFLGNNDSTNVISGKIKLGKEVLASISGHWDREMYIKDTKTNEETILFAANNETKAKRLVRYMVPLEQQLPNESERLWNAVTLAIKRDDQIGATEEKTILEEAQRKAAKDRKVTAMEWDPYLFKIDELSGQWLYKYADLRPWDPRNDVKQYETDFQVLTKSKLKAPKLARTTSLVSRQSLSKLSQTKTNKYADTDSSVDNIGGIGTTNLSKCTVKNLAKTLDVIKKTLDDHSKQLDVIKKQLDAIHRSPANSFYRNSSQTTLQSLMTRYVPESVPESTVIKTVTMAFIGILFCLIIKWFSN